MDIPVPIRPSDGRVCKDALDILKVLPADDRLMDILGDVPLAPVYIVVPLVAVMLLSEDDLALLTSLAFEEYTQGEIAQQNHQNQQAISRQLQQIRKTFGKRV